MYNPLTKRLNLKQLLLLFWNDYESVPAILHQIHGQILVDILANSFRVSLVFNGPLWHFSEIDSISLRPFLYLKQMT